MWPVLVVVAAVDAEHVLEMTAADDEDPVEAVGADCAHPAFGEGVRVRRLNWRADDLDAFGAEDLIEGVAELRVAIVDEESEGVLVAELDGEVARLLGDPASVRLRGASDVLNPPRCERDEEENVDPKKMVSTVRKSQASRLAACVRRNARHDECVRCGAGLRAASSSTFRTDVAETATPRPF